MRQLDEISAHLPSREDSREGPREDSREDVHLTRCEDHNTPHSRRRHLLRFCLRLELDGHLISYDHKLARHRPAAGEQEQERSEPETQFRVRGRGCRIPCIGATARNRRGSLSSEDDS